MLRARIFRRQYHRRRCRSFAIVHSGKSPFDRNNGRMRFVDTGSTHDPLSIVR
jgi:hypothetical protein